MYVDFPQLSIRHPVPLKTPVGDVNYKRASLFQQVKRISSETLAQKESWRLHVTLEHVRGSYAA